MFQARYGFALAFCSQVSINVAKSVGPAFQLNQVGSLGSYCQVNCGLSIVNHERKSVLLQGRDVSDDTCPEQRVARLELTFVDVNSQRHDRVAFVASIDEG